MYFNSSQEKEINEHEAKAKIIKILFVIDNLLSIRSEITRQTHCVQLAMKQSMFELTTMRD